LTILFVCVATTALMTAGALMNRVDVLNDMLNGNVDLQKARNADSSVAALVGLTLLLTLATIVVFIIWFHRAATNNEVLGRREPRYSPGWAIGSWFIPFANFVIPVLIAQDLWRGSDPTAVSERDGRRGKGSALVGWWWALFLISRLATFGGTSSTTQSGSARDAARSLKTSDTAASGGMLVTVAAAVLAIAFVRKLSNRQAECFGQQASRGLGW
jgi:hypothetical protein